MKIKARYDEDKAGVRRRRKEAILVCLGIFSVYLFLLFNFIRIFAR